jgi:predicted TIM-barrel fold metal-dependent hydrolase
MKNITLKYYKGKKSKCFNRTKRNNKQNAVVDAHFHMRPFGGPPIEFKKMINILNKNGILFANIDGKGQKLPTDQPCTHYKDCPGVKLKPSITNDIISAQLVLDNNLHKPEASGVKVNLSMTFPDLSKPDEVVEGIYFLDKEYPGLFNWMGEVQVVKEALFKNGHKPISMRDIPKWVSFMKILKKRKIPLAIHSDLGNNKDNFKYLPLLENILKLYPNNNIILSHLGLSKELNNISSKEHTDVLNELLNKYKNLYCDISWNILYNHKFKYTSHRQFYVDLMNKHPTRFLTGTDFVSHISKTEKTYKKDLKVTSNILKYLNNYAYRRIALGQNYLDLIRSNYKAPRIC